MISVVVISKEAPFSESVRRCLAGHDVLLCSFESLAAAKNSVRHKFDLCILRVIDCNDQAITNVTEVRKFLRDCQLLVVGEHPPDGWKNQVYERGADYVMDTSILSQMLPAMLVSRPVHAPSGHSHSMKEFSPMAQRASINRPNGPDLGTLRDLSRILSHSLDYRSLVEHFILKVREIVGVNRVAIFLESPQLPLLSSIARASPRLHCACMVGIASHIQKNFELSQAGGVGGWVVRHGQILRFENTAAVLSPTENIKAQREFEILNCQVAVPINDREKTIGVAMLGGHLTRIGFSDDELQLLFHLMEELGLSVKNCWLHQQLAWNNDLFNEVFDSMHSGSMVIGPELDILKANPAIVDFLDAGGDRTLEFSDIPGALATQIHGAVEQRESPAPFFVSLPEDRKDKLFRVTIIPLNQDSQGSQPVMVVMEDFTEIESAKKAEVEASNLRLTALIAKRFAHETRNSLVPLTTHLQLLDDRYDTADFKESLKKALKDETGRIARFTEQLLFLSQPRILPGNVVSLEKLLREGFAEAQQYIGIHGILDIRNTEGCHLRCHSQSVKLAFQEIFMNALQAGGDDTQIHVSAQPRESSLRGQIAVHFRDSGPGFSPETARRATEAFFATRNTGIGLGLTIARKIVEDHGGSLETHPRSASEPDVVVILPAESIQHD